VRSASTLLPVVALPPFAAILVLGEKAMASVLDGQSPGRWLVTLGVAAIVYVALGILLYGVAEES
jgi:ABC-type transport system involved in cytochrome c biogenesis permease component